MCSCHPIPVSITFYWRAHCFLSMRTLIFSPMIQAVLSYVICKVSLNLWITAVGSLPAAFTCKASAVQCVKRRTTHAEPILDVKGPYKSRLLCVCVWIGTRITWFCKRARHCDAFLKNLKRAKPNGGTTVERVRTKSWKWSGFRKWAYQ